MNKNRFVELIHNEYNSFGGFLPINKILFGKLIFFVCIIIFFKIWNTQFVKIFFFQISLINNRNHFGETPFNKPFSGAFTQLINYSFFYLHQWKKTTTKIWGSYYIIKINFKDYSNLFLKKN